MDSPGAIFPNTISFSSKIGLSLSSTARTRYAGAWPTFLTTPRSFASVPAAIFASGVVGCSVSCSCGSPPPDGAALQSTPCFSSACDTFLSSAARTLSRNAFEASTRSRRRLLRAWASRSRAKSMRKSVF